MLVPQRLSVEHQAATNALEVKENRNLVYFTVNVTDSYPEAPAAPFTSSSAGCHKRTPGGVA